jgi:hypothetical protein
VEHVWTQRESWDAYYRKWRHYQISLSRRFMNGLIYKHSKRPLIAINFREGPEDCSPFKLQNYLEASMCSFNIAIPSGSHIHRELFLKGREPF